MDFFSIFYEYSYILLCCGIASTISFIDILDDYSIFRVKVGLRYKLGFALMNGIVSLIVLALLWNSEIIASLNPLSKGLYVGLGYSVLLKSKIVLYGKSSPFSPEDIYKKIIQLFRDLINDSTRDYITQKKIELATKYSLEELYQIAKNAITDDPSLGKEGNLLIKKEKLKGIFDIKNDTEATEEERAQSLAKFLIDTFPGSINKLLDPR